MYESYVPTPDDVQLFRDIKSFILANADHFKAAGKSFDDEYGPVGYIRRLAREKLVKRRGADWTNQTRNEIRKLRKLTRDEIDNLNTATRAQVRRRMCLRGLVLSDDPPYKLRESFMKAASSLLRRTPTTSRFRQFIAEEKLRMKQNMELHLDLMPPPLRENGKRIQSVMAHRFGLAVKDIVGEADRLNVLKLEDKQTKAERIALMTWLITDPDINDKTPLITEFQRLGWRVTGNDPLLNSIWEQFQPHLQHNEPDYFHDRYYTHRVIFKDHPKWLELALWAWKELKPAAVQPQNDVATTSPNPSASAPSPIKDVPPNIDDLPDRVKIAHDQYQKACESLGKDSPTDREAYDAFENAFKLKGMLSPLPDFATWTSYLRQWRRATGQQKNKSRATRQAEAGSLKHKSGKVLSVTRPHGASKSVISAHEIEYDKSEDD